MRQERGEGPGGAAPASFARQGSARSSREAALPSGWRGLPACLRENADGGVEGARALPASQPGVRAGTSGPGRGGGGKGPSRLPGRPRVPWVGQEVKLEGNCNF